jgi:hypothetical protein
MKYLLYTQNVTNGQVDRESACYGRFLGSKPVTSQNSKTRGHCKGVANTLLPAKEILTKTIGLPHENVDAVLPCVVPDDSTPRYLDLSNFFPA